MRSLKIGLALFNEDVIDSSTAIIYNQIPSISDLEVINLGRNIDVYLNRIIQMNKFFTCLCCV